MAIIARTLTPDTFFENALPALEEVIYQNYNQHKDMIPMLAKVETKTGWGTQSTEQSGVGPAAVIPEGASITYDDIVQGNSKTFTFVKYGIGVKVTEEMIEDDKWGQVRDIYASLGASMFHIRQQVFMDNFNNGFTTNGYDGVPLFSTAHPLVKAGGTQGNRPTTDADLSVTSLQDCLTQIMNWLSHEGINVLYHPKLLLCSTRNIYDAHELLKSDYRPDTANNAVNYFTVTGMEYAASPYLADADAWFVKCDEHRLMFYERKAPETKSFEDFDAGALKTKITCRFDTGHSSWYGWWGTSGA